MSTASPAKTRNQTKAELIQNEMSGITEEYLNDNNDKNKNKNKTKNKSPVGFIIHIFRYPFTANLLTNC